MNPNPQISVNKTDVSCFGGLDGSASVVVESADGSLNYLWSNNATTQTIGNLAAGNFSVAATDGNSCKANASIVISQPGKIEIASTVFTASCPDAADGRIELRITGGTGAYAFAWNTGSTTNAINNLGVGLYSVSVRDANSCESEMDFDLGYIREICFDIPGIITPNNDSYNDTWIIDGLELYSGNTVEIFDRYGKRVFYMKSYDNSWDGVYEGKELPMESYHYVINLNNGTAILKGNITIVR